MKKGYQCMKKKIPLWQYKQFSNMCPKCLNAASKATMVPFSTSSSHVLLVHIHKSKSMRSTKTSMEKNGRDWKKERLGHGAQRTRLAWEIKRRRWGLGKNNRGKKKRKMKEVGKNSKKKRRRGWTQRTKNVCMRVFIEGTYVWFYLFFIFYESMFDYYYFISVRFELWIK